MSSQENKTNKKERGEKGYETKNLGSVSLVTV
jgi:hypothetical protein